MGIRVKSFGLVKSDETSDYHFSGYASTYGNADRELDVMVAGCFDNTVSKKTTIPMLYNHDRNQVIGKIDLSLDDSGLIAKGTFNLNDQKAQNVKDLVDMGALDSMSIGLLVKDYEPVDAQRPFGGWNIKDAEVVETSIVTVPANEQALITDVKSMDAEMLKEAFKSALREHEQEKADIEAKAKALEQKRAEALETLQKIN